MRQNGPVRGSAAYRKRSGTTLQQNEIGAPHIAGTSFCCPCKPSASALARCLATSRTVMFCSASLLCSPVVQEQNAGEDENDSRRHRDDPCDDDDARDRDYDIGHADDERSASPVNGCPNVFVY